MSLRNIALIVDGPTEEGSFRTKFEMNFYDCPNIRIGPGNGIHFTTQGYAKGVLPTIKFLLSSSIRAIILIPDLEKRKEEPINFGNELKFEIIKLLINESNFKKDYLNEVLHVCPPNIMFENWILSDIEGIKINSLINSDTIQKSFDGKNGSTELQRIMTTKYKKTVHAKQLFKITRDEVNCINSLSFKTFHESLYQLIEMHCK